MEVKNDYSADLEYLSKGKGGRLLYSLRSAFKALPFKIWGALKAAVFWIWRLIKRIGLGFKNFGLKFYKGDIITKLSFFIVGLGALTRKQVVKGLVQFAAVAMYIVYMTAPLIRGQNGWFYMSGLSNLGKLESTTTLTPGGNEKTILGDHSSLILLYGIMTLFLTAAALMVYVSSVNTSYKNQLTVKSGGKPQGFIKECKQLLDGKFHITLLTLPSIGTLLLTILPLTFMISLAFTNYDVNHLPPTKLFTWVGFNNFKSLFTAGMEMNTFWPVLGWTLIWAFFATFSNYFLGIIVALLINAKGIRLKKVWRTILVITAAVPQFVTLLIMRLLLDTYGPVNSMLQQWGWISSSLPFLTNATWARVTVIVVNLWIGIPFTMLITTGILMNIPADLYEAAKIDGANPVKMFFDITLPFVLFATTPYLITQFIGNINNFNLIFLLTGGGPSTLAYYQAGKTDLLITWLYKLTLGEKNYKMASTIGIMVFIISAVFSLLTYTKTSAYKKEEEFS